MADLGGIFEAIGGLGAGMSGRSTEWQQERRARAKQDEEMRLLKDAESRQESVRLAYVVKGYLDSGNTMQAQQALSQGLERFNQRGLDTSDLSMLMTGLQRDPKEASMLAGMLVDYANQYGVGGKDEPAQLTYFNAMTSGMSEADREMARRVTLGLEPRAQGRQVTMIGGVPHVVDRAAGMAYSLTTGEGVPITPEMISDYGAVTASGPERARQAVTQQTKIFEQLRPVETSIANLAKARNALKRGANTGVVAEFFPSVTEASITLDNVRNQMGLDIVGATTFGALSESELAFALDTAMPTGLDERALDEWLARKEAAQKKLHRELVKSAVWLQRNPEKGMGGYIEYLKESGQLEFGESEDAYTKWKRDQGID